MPHEDTHLHLLNVTCGSIVIPGRIVAAPINTGFARDGNPIAKLNRFHSTRSGCGIGISFVGNVAIDPIGTTNHRTAVLSSHSAPSRFAVIARTITRQGSLPGIQLSYSPQWLSPTRKWICKDVQDETNRLKHNLLSMTDIELGKIMTLFQNSAKIAATIGFSVIQLHAGHGYLLSMLLDPLVNVRVGYFSASGPWLHDLLQSVRSSSTLMLSVRLSLLTGLRNHEADLEVAEQIGNKLSQFGVDIIDWSSGFYTITRNEIYPRPTHDFALSHPALNVAKLIPAIHIINGGITHLERIDELPNNVLVGLGRALLADPHMVAKTIAGKIDYIKPCQRTGRCHYFTRNQESIECGVNTHLGETGR